MSFLLFFTVVPFYFLSAIQGVASHGYVRSVVIDGQEIPGWQPFVDPYMDPVPERIIRRIASDGPVVDTNMNDINCGKGADAGTSVVTDIAAGSQITFKWGSWPSEHKGPVSTYMASCDGDCTNFSAGKAKWFKVDAGGYNPTDGRWAAEYLIDNNGAWTSTIPAQLQPGQYLVRNEIVALHSLPAQYYPSCAQVRVTGSGTQVPSNLVSMQDVYRDFKWPAVWGDMTKVSFTIPGPAPAFGGNTEEPPSPPSSTASTSASSETGSGIPEGQQTPPTSTATRAPAATTTGNGHCRLQSRKLLRKRLARNTY